MITEITRIGGMVVQQVTKPNGEVVRIQYGKPGDAGSFKQANSIEEARIAIIPLVAKTVDRIGDILIQKVTKNGDLMHYQHGSETLGWVVVKTLKEARLQAAVMKENAQ